MSNLERLPTWVSQFETTQDITEYEDLANVFTSLRIRVQSKQKINEEEDKEFLDIIKTSWKRIIAGKYNEIKNKIETRKTKGQTFFNNLEELEKIRRRGEKDLPVEEYHDLYKFDLLNIEKEVDEKISDEKHQKTQNWDMLIISFILGIIGTLITQYFFN